MLRRSLLVRYFNGGTATTGLIGPDSSGDSGIDESVKNSEKDDNEDNCDDDISTTSTSRLKTSNTEESSNKTPSTNLHQHHLPIPRSMSWSPPPPISFRSDQQLQQQHRVTHGPGGEQQFT